jgi:hypothetical protein
MKDPSGTDSINRAPTRNRSSGESAFDRSPSGGPSSSISAQADAARREIRRVGTWVIIAIVIWSAGWFTIHKFAEARHHAVAAHARG